MKEITKEGMQTQIRSERSSKVFITAIVAAVIITVACMGGFLVTVILVLDEIPFHHIFAN